METINKTYTSIGFVMENIPNQESKMKIIFYDNEVDNDVIHNIDVTVINNNSCEIFDEDDFDISDYQLSLEFTGNYIKKLLKNLMEFTEDFIIQIYKDGPLIFPLGKDNVETHYIFKNIEKINAKYTGEDDIMTTSCKIGYLSPLGKEFISDIIKIYAHPFKNLIFEMENDILNLKINIQIIKF
jgi:hypothetical protein